MPLNPRQSAGRLISAFLLLLIPHLACDKAPSEPAPSPVGTQQARLDPPTLFREVAMVGPSTPACTTGTNNYGIIDNCYNIENPQRPSIFRELSSAWRPPRPNYSDALSLRPANLTGVMQPFPPFDYDNGWSPSKQPETADAASAIQVLPFQRGTNDARLFIRGGCRGCAEGSTLFTFRPETLGHDFRYDFASKGTQFAQPSNSIGLHPFIYFNPMDTGLEAKHNNDFPDSLQSTLCENSTSAQLMGSHGRNPVACTARYDVGSPPRSGDCYEISALYGLHAPSNDRWELRSVDLTVFIRDPKTLQAGTPTTLADREGWGIWVYPRNPEGEVKSLPTWELPPFRPFDFQATSWSDIGTNSPYTFPGRPDVIDWKRLFTTNPGYRCYTALTLPPATEPVYLRNTTASAPKWCQFFDRQHYRSSYQVEDDEDAVIGNGRFWNGSGGQKLNLFEIATSGDGTLLIVNMNGLFYSASNTSCNAATWSHFKPISMMPKDPAVNTRYPLAKSQVINGQPQPFRDTLGNAIPFGVTSQWAYAWLDRDAKNLFFAAKNHSQDGYFAREVRAYNKSNGQLSTSILGASSPPNSVRWMYNPDRAAGQAIGVLGAWTRGKVVLFDNGLNLTDMTGFVDDNFHREYSLGLYAGDLVRFTPKGSTHIFSFENQLNHFDGMRPTLPFDVVWNFQSSNQRNSQVAFDDYLNTRAFVVAHMNAAMRMDVSPYHANWRETYMQDGFVPLINDREVSVRFGGLLDFRFMRNPLAQNAATGHPLDGTGSPQPPSYLRLRGGARIEPVALGGVSGKGVWLDGQNDFMDMGFPVNSAQRDWLFGIWLDSRQDTVLLPGAQSARSLPRTLFYFSDNSWVGLVQAKDSSGKVWHELDLHNGPRRTTTSVNLGSLVQSGRYFHFGMKIFNEAGQRKVTLYIDGTQHSTHTVAPNDVGFDPMFNSMNGWTWMDVSDPGPSFGNWTSRLPFLGWVDELRIYALAPGDAQQPWTEELLCNQALGTTVDVSTYLREDWHPRLELLRSRARQYPGGRQTMCEQMELRSYSEPLDYPAQHGTGLCIDRVHKNPHTTFNWAGRCLRSGMLALPPLQATQPRFDTRANAFCLSCHQLAAPLPGLDIGALAAGTKPRFEDPRRQPMNVPAVMGGVVPPWLTTGINQPDGTRTLDHYFDHYPAP